ncbi:hypothetical protein NLM16_16695 [Bradyrhizobium brasilense]|uniref:hypothetical protein n=1 Tax=Bradyrhizobium brasilense TaxID=1419277 RepID=UPI0028774D41|nr:hypothetical protein [Bradyrhizobium brasilense]MCP3415739.1 hypothetical protein [Bradyrhizobium brasilense]
MSRSAMRVTSDILGLKVLIADVIHSLSAGPQLPQRRRKALSSSFHRYISDAGSVRLRPNGLSYARFGARQLPSTVVREEAVKFGTTTVLSAVDLYARGQLSSKKDIASLVEFLTQVDHALDKSRAELNIGRYL